MNTDALLSYAEALLRKPTAPFHEDAVRAEILRFLGFMPHVRAEVDPLGNILAVYQRGGRPPEYLLNAHMDHPAFVGGEFRGGVPAAYLKREHPVKNHGRFATWDLPAFEVRDGRIYSGACDDLIGCAAILGAFAELEARVEDASIMACFTCAEEVGLLGAAYVARSAKIDKSIGIISLEASPERPPAVMHQGVIVRVGDRASVFDAELTQVLCDRAASAGVPFQRCLMSGGTCEATAYQAYGYRASGICVALGNYHNCGPDLTIAQEFVSVEDFVGMSRLCHAMALRGSEKKPSERMRERLERALKAECERFI